MAATLVNDFIAGLDPSVMPAISGAQLLQLVQQARLNLDRGLIITNDDLPTVVELTANPKLKLYLTVKASDNPKVIYGFDLIKFNANTNPPWSPIALVAGSITNSQLAGGIQLNKLNINPAVPGDAGKFVIVNGAGNGYVVQTFNIPDGSLALSKFSVTNGFINAFIKIKADGSAFEFVGIDDIAALLNDGTVEVRTLYTGGTAGTVAIAAIISPHDNRFTLQTIKASNLDATGVPLGYVLKSDGANHYIASSPLAAGGSYALIGHEENQGIGYSSVSQNVFFDRKLNTEWIDDDGIVTVDNVNNRFTLLAGKYRVNVPLQCYQTLENTAILYNVSDATEVLTVIAQGSYAQNNGGSTVTHLRGEFTIAVTKTFSVKQMIKLTGNVNDLGWPLNFAGRKERYMMVEIIKLV